MQTPHEQLLAAYERRKAVLDWLRRILIFGIWGGVTYLRMGVWWVWAAIWLIPGFFLVLNLSVS